MTQSIRTSADQLKYVLVETAGGPLSPGPSGTLQADLYRPLRLPVVLVGDSKLGGISATISAYESLYVRGYDVDSVILFRSPYENSEYLSETFAERGIKTYAIEPPPEQNTDPQYDQQRMSAYYEEVSVSRTITKLTETIDKKHDERLEKLSSLPASAESIIWHPFRQHAIPQKLLTIDSAYGDYFQGTETVPDKGEALRPFFDGSASWWTQGLGHGNVDLALTAAHAAGRYGHVMFASAVHAPAVDLSTKLLSLLKNPRLSRVFFSDNGSTGVEVALKMALRSASKRYGWSRDEPLGVLGLKGSYHGDCIGAMNCSEPNVYNETVDWYRPWGWWFEVPSLKLKNGAWVLESELGDISFPNMSAIFNFNQRAEHATRYRESILATLTRLTKSRKFGALICEPIVMGAGGMVFVDPLFQRTLIKTVRENPQLFGGEPTDRSNWSGLPLIADEVFSGLYRLGRASSTSFLSLGSDVDADVAPDISVHAKLLTGGLLPLAVTCASESIFSTFLSDRKPDALLHGHSYTAHAVGCSVAEKSLDTLQGLTIGWKDSEGAPWSFWNSEMLKALSASPRLDGVFALGSVLAIYIKTGESGYVSDAAVTLQTTLLEHGVHCRVLGNVLYLMASMVSKPESLARIEGVLLRSLVDKPINA